jgi:plasmid stabilization system protein ParE
VALRIFLSKRAFADLDRFATFLLEHDPDGALTVGRSILLALSILKAHPFIGRRHPDGLRELVISRGKYGYIALYRVDESRGLVRVLAIRHQREAGYFAD